jgi:CRISPR-associated protein Cmr2
MTQYTAVTFAPVQGFIERSRKLRDLYGASLILSYLSLQLIKDINEQPESSVVSPGLIHLQRGMPNRILVRGAYSEETARTALLSAWANILRSCQSWIEERLPRYEYRWDAEWKLWSNYTWEVFWGQGESIRSAMADLEERKLMRSWTGVNWTGESSSLSGTDAIAWPELGRIANPRKRDLSAETIAQRQFYSDLAAVLEGRSPGSEVEGKFLSPDERLSIPELVKRLVTFPALADRLGMERLDGKFSEIYRRPRDGTGEKSGRWTGWFMGDGDKVGDHLQTLAQQSEEAVCSFSNSMRSWGESFSQEFPGSLGRIIYAGGDDFLGVLYRPEEEAELLPSEAFEWLKSFPNEWVKHQQEINVSVGFVWVAPGVPQRDVLQHCRDAEKQAKTFGRDRVAIRVVFASGQYVQWICPWELLDVLDHYRDREGRTNWAHIYGDLAQLKARHAFEPLDTKKSLCNDQVAWALMEVYFPRQVERLRGSLELIIGEEGDPRKAISWINDLIQVGWHLCSSS